MTLQEKLQQFKQGVLAELSDADVALMDNATRELAQAGLVQRAKQAGEPAPLFSLPNTSGEIINLADLLTRGPVVITFYRGVW
jgi:hypothetical protein